MIPHLTKMFTDPAGYWNEDVAEPGDIKSLLMPQMAILAAIPAVGGFVGTSFTYLRYGLTGAFVGSMMAMIMQYAANIGGWILMGYIIDKLAQYFDAQQDLGQSMKLAAGAIIPGWLAGGLFVIPFIGSALGGLGMLAGLGYGGYMLFKGLPVMNNTPEDKSLVYTIATIFLMFVVSAIIMGIASGPSRWMAAPVLLR